MAEKKEVKPKQSSPIKNPQIKVILKYICMECVTTFESFEIMYRHIFNQHYCWSCDLFFEFGDVFDRHTFGNHNQITCPYCPSKQTFQDLDALTNHILAKHPEKKMDIRCAHETYSFKESDMGHNLRDHYLGKKMCFYRETGLTHNLMDHYLAHLVEDAEDYVLNDRRPITNDPVEFWVGIEENKVGRYFNSPKLKMRTELYGEEVEERLEYFRVRKEHYSQIWREQRAIQKKVEDARLEKMRRAEEAYQRRLFNDAFYLEDDYPTTSSSSCPCYGCNI